jgi:hypothetical protein
MLECNFGEVESYVCFVGDAPDVFDAVDLGEDFLDGEIPGVVCYFGEVHFGDGDVPGFYGGRVFVDWEELHVDCVGIIYSHHIMSVRKFMSRDLIARRFNVPTGIMHSL